MKTKPTTLSSVSLKTGMREYCCSRNSVLQLLDRRVGVDRDDVGPRRHHLAHHRLAEVDEVAQQLARLSLLAAARGSPFWARVRRGARRDRHPAGVAVAPSGAWRRELVADRSSAEVIGVSSRAIASNDGSSTSSTRSGSCRTISSGMRCSQVSTNDEDRQRPAAESRPVSTPVTRASSAAASTVMVPSSRRAGMNRRRGSSRYCPSASSRSLRSAVNAQRQPHQRAERR